MKKLVVPFILVCLAGILSCKKDKAFPQYTLINHTWRLTKCIREDGYNTTNLYQPCETTNTYNWNSDGSFVTGTCATLMSNCHWSLKDGVIYHDNNLGSYSDYSIEQLDNTTLKLRIQLRGIMYIMITFEAL